jgi:hypothetical protein
MDARQARRAQNEVLFREVNERVEEVTTGLTVGYGEDDALLIGFVCECGQEDCAEPLEVTHGKYEAVRRDPRHFLVFPGHEDTDLARVVERHGRFLVVEKLGEAAEIAVQQDPRS